MCYKVLITFVSKILFNVYRLIRKFNNNGKWANIEGGFHTWISKCSMNKKERMVKTLTMLEMQMERDAIWHTPTKGKTRRMTMTRY